MSEYILNMNMTGRDFAQARLMPFLEESGYIVRLSSTNIFTQWKFSDTSEENNKIVVKGPSFSGKPLADYFQIEDKKKEKTDKDFVINEAHLNALKKIELIQTAIQMAEEQKIELPFTGPYQVIIGDDDSLLFLPPTLVERSFSTFSDKEYSYYAGCWLPPGYDKRQAQQFALCSSLYTALTSNIAYSNKNSDDRCMDFIDANYIPLHCLIPSIPKQQSDLIHKILSCKKNIEEFPNIAEISQSIQTQTNFDSKYFLEKSTKEIKSITKRISNKRFRRNHQGGIIATVIGCAIAIVIGIISINNWFDKETTKSFTSIETVQAFYSAINHLNTGQLSACSKANAKKAYDPVVSSLYVNGKMRETYEAIRMETLPNWLESFASGIENNSIFGLTNFKIENDFYELDKLCPENKDNPISIENEFGEKITDKQIKSYKVSFYMISLNGQNLEVQQCIDLVDVTFSKNRWIVTSIQQTKLPIETSRDDFIKTLKKLLPNDVSITNTQNIMSAPIDLSSPERIQNKESLKTIVSQMKNDFPWL